MAEVTYWYGQAIKSAFNKEIDFNETDKIKCMLCTALTVDQDGDVYLSDVTRTETTGTGYTAGGKIMTNCAVTYDSGTNVLKFDADDVSWTSATFSAAYAIIYYSTGTESSSPLLFYINFNGSKSCNNGTFLLPWNASGIASITVS